MMYGYLDALRRAVASGSERIIEIAPFAVFVFLKGRRMLCISTSRRYHRNRARYRAWVKSKDYDGTPFDLWWGKYC